MDFEEKENFQKIIEEKDSEIERLKISLEQERTKFKNKLQDVHDYYENILAVLPGHVYWLDQNNVFLGCNDLQARDAKLNSRKDIVGKTNYDMLWKDQAEELNRLNDLVMDTGMPHTAEEYAVMANGLAIYFSQKTPLRDKNGGIIGVLGVSIDITERKKMEAALRRAKEAAEVANYAKTEFIANVSHDIHTPLSGIVGLAQLLENKIYNQEDKQYAHWIKESGKQLLELLNGVLQVVSEDQPNQNDLNEEVFDLRKSIHGIINLVLPSVKIKDLDLTLEIDEAVPGKLITDGAKLYRALLNLVGNAIKFTAKGTVKLKIEVVVDDKEYVQLKFSVEDTGIGISQELQTKVFDRFFRVNPAYHDEHGGHGVGLHVAQNYVGLLGGEIRLESELSKGSIFYFTLPLKVANIESPESQPELEQAVAENIAIFDAATSTNLPHILLVEANIVALRFIETLAMQTGCNFSSATDLESALKLIKSRDYDLILTDVELPGSSGAELARASRGWEKAEHKDHTPIVGLTTHSLDEADALEVSGMDKIVSKPVHLNLMQELVSQFISKKDGAS
ncbi:Aerobic respiration control sensor protein ArcB [Legionella massiliensis]|uniref:histidine kinase n=1 Tax=Legionella massiliensis TaxID=1034943 RepID=A0A078L291_9GAMM|nr:ATP-binding protein [Legionella massiliensis]CDZ78199.1 Aerobic respiration control sensor protein ArcB [Legionella massiliensis]CEE13937.1 Aerobic respiration control sensor protein ArcB [Legionella massiliensis]